MFETHTPELSILRVDASGRHDASTSRTLVDHFLDRLRELHDDLEVARHDVGEDVPLVDETWIAGNFSDPDERTEAHREALAYSNRLIADLHEADLLVVGTPIYNFSIPASLKAWIDQVARAGETFEYTEEGPRGLVDVERAVIAVASGGTEVGGDEDFATDYLHHALGFMGIDDVDVVAADQLMFDDDAVAEATCDLTALAETISFSGAETTNSAPAPTDG
jgi:FMN-dependent NADH-azoreductase